MLSRAKIAHHHLQSFTLGSKETHMGTSTLLPSTNTTQG